MMVSALKKDKPRSGSGAGVRKRITSLDDLMPQRRVPGAPGVACAMATMPILALIALMRSSAHAPRSVDDSEVIQEFGAVAEERMGDAGSRPAAGPDPRVASIARSSVAGRRGIV